MLNLSNPRNKQLPFWLLAVLLLLLTSSCLLSVAADTTPGNGDGDDNDNDDDTDPNTPPEEITSQLIQIGIAYRIDKKLKPNNLPSLQAYQPAGYYSVKISKKIANKDLVIMVSGREDYSHSPALVYSKSNQLPALIDDKSNSENINCGLTGHDFCIVPKEDISDDLVVYIGVFCRDSCKFDITVRYDTTFHQNLNESARYESNRQETFLMEVIIDLPADLRDDISHILIECYLLNFLNVATNFHMYVNKGSDVFPTPSQFDFLTETMKLNGQSVLIERDSDGFKPGGSFAISVEVPINGQMLLRSEAFSKIRPVFFFKSVDDMVKQQDVRIFRLEISQYTSSEWDQSELSIDLEPFFGNPDLHVIRSELPANPFDLDSYTWHSQESIGMESLTLSKHQVGVDSFIGQVFYIAVYGRTAATFNLVAYASSIDNRELMFNAVEIGYASDEDVIAYMFFVDSEKDVDVDVHLSTQEGSNNLYIRKCKYITAMSECPLTAEYISSQNGLSSSSDTFMRSEEHSRFHKISFKYSAEDCIDASIRQNICVYVVGVQNVGKSDSQFRLTAKHSASSFLMQEGIEYSSYLLESEVEYFEFPIAIEDLTIQKVEFTVTAISGDIQVFSSRKIPFPSGIDSEQAMDTSEDTITYVRNATNETLKGSYYVAVQAVTGCIYTIHVKIYRQDKKNTTTSSSLKQLTLGSVEKGYLAYEQPHQYYFRVPSKERSATHVTSISFYFSAYRNKQEQNVDIVPQISVQYVLDHKTYPVERAEEDFTSSDFMYIKLKTTYMTNGRYVITLSHKDALKKDYSIGYQLNVNADNVVYIVPKVQYVSEVGVGLRDLYELYLSEDSQRVYLEVFECFGKVKVQASNTLQGIESQNYDVKTNQPSKFVGDHLIVDYVRTKTGPLYISVIPIIGIPVRDTKNALYMIIPHVLPSNQVTPHDVYSTPAEGSISSSASFKFDSEFNEYVSDLEISFNPIECANGCVDSIYTATSYEYIVHISNKEDLMQFYSKCDLQTYQLQFLGLNATEVIHERQTLTVEPSKVAPSNHSIHFLNLKNGTYYVEIMGIVYFESNSANSAPKRIAEPFTFIYPMAQVVLQGSDGTIDNNDLNQNGTDSEHQPHPGWFPPWMTFLLGTALLVLAIICIYKQVTMFLIRRKYRIAMEEQELQNADVEGVPQNQVRSAGGVGQDINDEDEKDTKGKKDQIKLIH